MSNVRAFTGRVLTASLCRPPRLSSAALAQTSPKSPGELGRYVSSEMPKWVKLAKIAGNRGD